MESFTSGALADRSKHGTRRKTNLPGGVLPMKEPSSDPEYNHWTNDGQTELSAKKKQAM